MTANQGACGLEAAFDSPTGKKKKKKEKRKSATAAPSRDRPKQCHSMEEQQEERLAVELLQKSQNPDLIVNSMQMSKCREIGTKVAEYSRNSKLG